MSGKSTAILLSIAWTAIGLISALRGLNSDNEMLIASIFFATSLILNGISSDDKIRI